MKMCPTETCESENILMQHPPFVTYTQLHEKIINGFVLLLAKHGPLCSLLFRTILVIAIILPLVILLLLGDDRDLLRIWLPCVCAVLFVFCVLIPRVTREAVWETINDVNNDFYEPAIVDSRSGTYQTRPIEDIYYSNGLWRTCDTNHVMKFRGVNLPAKTPTYGHDPDIFYSAKKRVSFVGTPIPLEKAREDFQRLSLYGFNLLRLVVTWEAVMHEGPGIIDTEYLAYLSQLVDIAAEFGLYVIIDPHQDVWSRFTGGDGAPWWTLDVAGFVTDDDRLHQSGAAFVDHLQDRVNDPPAKMIWTTNYGKLATATMFTLFFAGDDYAPDVYVDESYTDGQNDVTMQTFLQKYFLEYFETVAEAVKDKRNVIGFNTMNEPSNGYVGIDDLRKRTYAMPFGCSMNYFDGMRVGGGEALEVQYFSAPFYYHSRKVVNPDELIAWKTSKHDIWKKVGVYDADPDTGELRLQLPHYFSLDGKDFIEEYMLPLFEKIQTIVSRYNQKFIVYAEPFIDVNDHHYPNAPTSLDRNKFAWAPHWYDGSPLMLRKYSEWFALDDERKIPVVTKGWIDSTFKRILKNIRQTGNGKLHVVLGETGVPFDLDTANEFEASTKALDRTMRALEANDLDFTLWNYFPTNTIEKGDNWCGEDLSVRMIDRNRSLLTLIRPFVYKVSSDFEIIRQKFDPSKTAKNYELTVRLRNVEGVGNKKLHIYLPHFHYQYPSIVTTHGGWEWDKNSQILIWDCSESIRATEKVVLTIENSVDDGFDDDLVYLKSNDKL